MNKKDNVLKKWWFTLGVIPVVITIVILSHAFIKGDWGTLNYTILQWLIIFVLAIAIQTYFVFKNKVKYKAEHYTFIGFSILITIFVGFGLSFVEIVEDHKWVNSLVSSLISFMVLFIFKTIMWQALHIKSTSSLNKDERLKQLEQENEIMKNDNETLKKEISFLKGEEVLPEDINKKKWWKNK